MIEEKLIAGSEEKLAKTLLEYKAGANPPDSRYYNLIKGYVYQYHRGKQLKAVDEAFFRRFYHQYLPGSACGLGFFEMEELYREWSRLADYVEETIGDLCFKQLLREAYNAYHEDTERTLFILKQMRRYGEMPLISRTPFIVDMNCYRTMKEEEDTKYILYNQGYYVLLDRLGNNLIFGKLREERDRYKLKLDLALADKMLLGDIAHMRIKRKMFSTTWNIIDVKGYYGGEARAYL